MLINLNHFILSLQKKSIVAISEKDYDKICAPVVSSVECGNEFTSEDMSSSYTYMKDDTLTYNNLIEVATFSRTVSNHKDNLNTVYSTFKIMIEKFRKGEVFEVNYTNLNDLPKHDGSKLGTNFQ